MTQRKAKRGRTKRKSTYTTEAMIGSIRDKGAADSMRRVEKAITGKAINAPAGIDVDLEMAEQLAATPDDPDWEPASILGEACIQEPDMNEIDGIVSGVLKGSGEITPSHREKLRRAILERLADYLNGLVP